MAKQHTPKPTQAPSNPDKGSKGRTVPPPPSRPIPSKK